MHEQIRIHSMEAGKRIKQDGMDNDLLKRVIADDKIPLSEKDIERILNPKEFIGRAPEQTVEFIENEIDPLISRYKTNKNFEGIVNV